MPGLQGRRTASSRRNRAIVYNQRRGRPRVKHRWVMQWPLLCVVVVWMSGCAPKPVTFTTTYQAVLLGNNSVYFGKLSGYGTPNPVLTDVLLHHQSEGPADPASKEYSGEARQRVAWARSNVLESRANRLRGTSGGGFKGGTTDQRSREAVRLKHKILSTPTAWREPAAPRARGCAATPSAACAGCAVAGRP